VVEADEVVAVGGNTFVEVDTPPSGDAALGDDDAVAVPVGLRRMLSDENAECIRGPRVARGQSWVPVSAGDGASDLRDGSVERVAGLVHDDPVPGHQAVSGVYSASSSACPSSTSTIGTRVGAESLEERGVVMKKVFALAVLVLIVAFAVKLVAAKKSEWEGMSEADVRAMIDARMPSRVSDERRAVMADKVVVTMRRGGVLAEDDGEGSTSVEADAVDEPTGSGGDDTGSA